jgi:hypothetical protein
MEKIPGSPGRQDRRRLARGAEGYGLVDLDTGELEMVQGLTPEPSRSNEVQDDINLRNFSGVVQSWANRVSGGEVLSSEGETYIRTTGKRLGIDQGLIDSAVASLKSSPDRLPLSAGDRMRLQGQAKVEDIGLQLLEKLSDPKVAEGLGRVGGLENTIKAAITGNDPSLIAPELLAYWSQFGIYLDNIIRSWSGAQINEQEAARIADILGGKYRSAGGMKIAIMEMVKNAKDTQSLILDIAEQQKTGNYRHRGRNKYTVNYALMDDDTLKLLAADGDTSAEAEMLRREKGR